jgi:hypothetical protein
MTILKRKFLRRPGKWPYVMVNDGGWKDGVADWTNEAGKTASVAAYN